MKFSLQHLILRTAPTICDETNAPDWLTSENSKPGSTMDYRWFWTDHVLTLQVGESVCTDYHRVTRIE